MRGNIKSFEKAFTPAEVVALAERTLKRFKGDRNAAGRYARSMEDRYESAKWAQVVEVIATGTQAQAVKKTPPAQLEREIAEALTYPASTRGSDPFEDAKAERDLIQKEVDAAGAVLRTFPKGGPLGLTPDAVRATPEFRAANARFQKAFARLRAFNTIYVKRFANEIRAERAQRYGSR